MKPKTYFIDIDGCIFQHFGIGASEQWFSDAPILENVREFFDQAESRGDCIILVTARKESLRGCLEESLHLKHIFYDQLIMGVTSGERVIVNDRKPGGAKSCSAIELERNTGLCILLELS